MKKLATALFLCLCYVVTAQRHEAYRLYDARGKVTSFQKMLKQASVSDVVFFGEFHDNPMSHWLQLELLHGIHSIKNEKVQLGMEMLERDQQKWIDAYINQNLTYQQLSDSTKLWVNFETDYLPLLDFAREKKLVCQATNVPRRYANKLFKKGWGFIDSLTDTERSYLCPLPIEIDSSLSQYAEILKMAEHMKGTYMLPAQALKDATMAHSIKQLLRPSCTYLHINGAFHTDFKQGINSYLTDKSNHLKVLNITTVSQHHIDKLEKEHLNRADFIICVPDNMTKTH
jgi:uncharacterized iron-regulated protein